MLKKTFIVLLSFLSLNIVWAASPRVSDYLYESRIVLSSTNTQGVNYFSLSPEILQKINLDFSNFNLFNLNNDSIDFSLFYEPYGKIKNMKVSDISSQKDNPMHLIDNNLLTSFSFDERVDGKENSWVLLEFESPISLNTVYIYPKERAQIRYVEVESGLTKTDLRKTVSKQSFRRVYDVSTPLVKYLKLSFWGSSIKLEDIQLVKDSKGVMAFTPKESKYYKVLYGGKVDVITYENRSNKIPHDIEFEGFFAKEVLNPLFPEDFDKDGILTSTDNCPFLSNKSQNDSDGDGVGDVCDNAKEVRNITQLDIDQDGIGDIIDNCKLDHNPDQADLDDDGLGNACDGAHAKESSSPEIEKQKETYQKYIPGVFLISLGIFLFFLLYKQKNSNPH